MLEGIIVSAIVAYAGGWAILKFLYWLDAREAKRIQERMHRNQLIKHGRTFSHEEIIERGKADVLHGWD